jgi:hypothetical protein
MWICVDMGVDVCLVNVGSRYLMHQPSIASAGLSPTSSFAGVCAVLLEVCTPFLDPRKPSALKVDMRYLSEVRSVSFTPLHAPVVSWPRLDCMLPYDEAFA